MTTQSSNSVFLLNWGKFWLRKKEKKNSLCFCPLSESPFAVFIVSQVIHWGRRKQFYLLLSILLAVIPFAITVFSTFPTAARRVSCVYKKFLKRVGVTRLIIWRTVFKTKFCNKHCFTPQDIFHLTNLSQVKLVAAIILESFYYLKYNQKIELNAFWMSNATRARCYPTTFFLNSLIASVFAI